MLSSGAANQRFSDEQLALTASIESYDEGERCFGAKLGVKPCEFGLKNQPSTWFLWGDSHAKSLLPVISDLAKREGRRFVFASAPACPPLLGVERRHAFGPCTRYREEILSLIEATSSVETVIVVARWPVYVEGRTMPVEEESDVVLYPEGERKHSSDLSNNAALVESGLIRVRDRILASGKRMILIQTVPEISWDVAARIKAQILFDRPIPDDPDLQQVAARQKRANEILERVADKPGVLLVPVANRICTPICPTHDRQAIYYRDNHHLTPAGARTLIANLVEQALRPVPSSSAIMGN